MKNMVKLTSIGVVLAAGVPAFAMSEKQIDALVAGMTLEEKVGQLVQVSSGWGDGGPASQDASNMGIHPGLAEMVRKGRAGALLGSCGIKNYNALQKIALEQSRLKIPLLVGHDMIHGVETELPIPLALSCAWDSDLWRRSGEMIAREAPLWGCNWTFAPMVDISRDPRWGRIAEGPGQDALLASAMSASLVRGIQTDAVENRIAACLKHYVGYGAPFGGRDYNAVEMSESTLRNVYLPPFQAGAKAGALTLMPAFHTFNGVPCSMNKWLLTDILRREIGFKGLTISDYNAIGECSWNNRHGVVEEGPAAAAKALDAGMDVDMMSNVYSKNLAEAVRQGLVKTSRLDEAVKNVLSVKNALGLFEKPFIDEKAVKARYSPEDHLQLAREAVHKSCVLLKNDNATLPFDRGKKVFLVGWGAKEFWNMLGCWIAGWGNCRHPTLRDGFQGLGIDFEYIEGFAFRDEPVDEAGIREHAARCDIIVACFGENGVDAGENNSRLNLELSGGQLKALDVLKSTGKPLVAVLTNGRPLVINEVAKKADAVLEAWNAGTCGGWGIVELLTGVASPSGRLTTEFPFATGQCPLFYDHTRTGRPQDDAYQGERWATRYYDGPNGPLYPFGFGLTYTTFAYSNEKVSVDGKHVVFQADVANTGEREGVEVVQAYTHQLVAEESSPVRRLRGWKRVTLKPGERQTVTIRVPLASLGYWAGSKRFPAKGRMHAWIAPDSVRGRRLDFTIE